MTVKELIAELKHFPQDMEVFKDGESVGGNFFECVVYEPNITHRYVKTTETDSYIAQRPCEETKGARKCLIL